MKEGYHFNSDTDSEVIAQLIDYYKEITKSYQDKDYDSIPDFCEAGIKKAKGIISDYKEFSRFHKGQEDLPTIKMDVQDEFNNIFNSVKSEFANYDANDINDWCRFYEISEDDIKDLLKNIEKAKIDLQGINSKLKINVKSNFKDAITGLIKNSLKHGYLQKESDKIRIKIRSTKINKNKVDFYYSDNGQGVKSNIYPIGEINDEFWEPFKTIGKRTKFGTYQIKFRIEKNEGEIHLLDQEDSKYNDLDLLEGFAAKFYIKEP